MKKFRIKRLRRMDIQVSLLTASIVILSCGLIFTFTYHLTYKDMIQSLQERVMGIYGYLESRIGEAAFLEIDSREDEDTTAYQEAKQLLESIRIATGVRYLYTAKQLPDGSFIYGVDGLPADSEDFRHAGDAIEPEIYGELERALGGEIILPGEIKDTSWGYIFISYLPVRIDGHVSGVLGVEFDAAHQFNTFRLLQIGTPLVILAACFTAVCFAVVLFKRISNPTFKDLANTDLLTGLKNRNAFETDMNNWNKQQRNGTVVFSIDLDDLKRINDTLGHPEGDQYISTGSSLIQTAAGPLGVLYRTGGDEFSLVLRDSDEDKALLLLERLSRLLDNQEGEETRQVSMSVGYAVFNPQIDKDIFDTFRRADGRMYEEKRQKKAARPEKSGR